MWFEELPEQCPPDSAAQPNGEFYRMIEGKNVDEIDFHSHRKREPNKSFNTCECIAKSLSIFDSFESCERVTKLPAHNGKKIAIVKLDETSGAIGKTGRDKSHYSWWRSGDFDWLSHSKVMAK